MRSRFAPLFSLLALTALHPGVEAQGRFSNFETPQTHPIEVATFNGADYVLVCNTPDNSVDIYTAAPPHTFLQRVPVGMGPATVRWNAALGRFYTCNFDGDSVSVVRLDPAGSSVKAVLERTQSAGIGDEPSDIAFDPTNTTAAVSLSSRSAIAIVNALDLTGSSGEVRLTATDPVSGFPWAVKMPRRISWLPDNRFFAANFRGGSPDPGATVPQYDLGIYRSQVNVPGATDFVGGLGTTNHSFAINSSGTLMFVVGTKAMNHSAVGVQAVSQIPTGFVQSWLMVVDIPLAGAMTVHAEAPIGAPTPQLPSINLNRNYFAASPIEVATDSALVQPTDVLLIESAGNVTKVVLTAFHSDRVAILSPSTGTPGGYIVQRINIPLLTPASYSVCGPRGLAYSAANHRIFTNGRLDNTITVINSNTNAVSAQFQLPNDPTPQEIRDGRKFLYSNRFSIDDSAPTRTGGFVSCAACHVDGRTDGLAWDLGSLDLGASIPPEFHDGNGLNGMLNFPDQKGPVVTQTLQGLINYPLNEQFQFAATNAPYHWRGDKADFTNFNEAFVHLQRMDNVGSPTDPKGVSDAEMITYRRFVNTILHPPNFEEDPLRTTTGTLGTNPNDPTTATGAKLGLMLYHDFPSEGGMNGHSCVDCHQLPDGSSNTSTDSALIDKTISGGGNQTHPLETAALRNIAQREAALHSDFSSLITQFTGNNGLLHAGNVFVLGSFSINKFVNTSFAPSLPGPDVAGQVKAITEFVRQFDTGTAPMAGSAYTVDPTTSPVNSGVNAIAFSRLEGQVKEANIGLGVYTRNNGVVKGYWYDITLSTPMYREEGTSNLLDRTALLNLCLGTDNVVVAQGTPLGTERRWSNPLGVGTQISGVGHPSQLTLESMAPNTAYVDVAKFNLFLHDSPFAPPDTSIWTLRTLQQSIVPLGFGVPALRHEPPRRFRVTGNNIRPGAMLLLGFATSNPGALPVQQMQMHLYPTQYTSGGRQVWETLVELDGTQTMALLNGGYWAAGVSQTLNRTSATPALQPALWNKYLVNVVNESGPPLLSTTNWQVLRVQDGR
jgi:DNA-binding beta-propeller fold protein YncE